MEGFNINRFIKGNEECQELVIPNGNIPTQTTEKKTRKPRKKEETVTTTTPAVATPIQPVVAQTSMSYLQENIPYASAYTDTTRQLDESIAQLNILCGELVGELEQVKSSKTLRNKYNYINDMTATATTIINSKISAIKEKNKVTGDVMKLEMDRLKTLKAQTSEQDDNTRIASMYDAFINTPVGSRVPMAPSVQDMMVMNGNSLNHMTLGGTDTGAWEQGLDPAQNRMLLEAKGVISTVVVYDESTGNRWFEVVDKTTGQPVPNVEKPDSTHIYDLDINVRNGYAKDGNRNTLYPLMVINSANPGNAPTSDDIYSKF